LDDHICIVVRSNPSESGETFRKRLIEFWSHVIRTRPNDYERVFAESAEPDPDGSAWTRKYLVHVEVADVLETELKGAGLRNDPIDRDDPYSKYEAAPPEWFQIPH
jgi:hypothetical protein